eukprot:1548012-Pleurochrysis_carterae.AAC.1
MAVSVLSATETLGSTMPFITGVNDAALEIPPSTCTQLSLERMSSMTWKSVTAFSKLKNARAGSTSGANTTDSCKTSIFLSRSEQLAWAVYFRTVAPRRSMSLFPWPPVAGDASSMRRGAVLAGRGRHLSS